MDTVKRRGSEPARWLSPEQREAWLELLGVCIWLPSALDEQLERDAGLSHFEYQVLARLSEAPGRSARMHELAAATNGSASRLSHTAGRLERQGWITRIPDPGNARFIRATLTEAGWQKVAESAPGHAEAVQHYVFDQLTAAQVRQLATIARKITKAAGPGRPA
jgi:DNA-binding MarR family transcriptional regulator